VLLALNKPEAALAEFELDTDEEFALKGRVLSFHVLNRTADFANAVVNNGLRKSPTSTPGQEITMPRLNGWTRRWP
jgi:hypothetical protein